MASLNSETPAKINGNTPYEFSNSYPISFRNTVEYREMYTPNVDASQEEICKDWIFDPMARRTVNINPSFRNKKRKEEFDPLKFLMDKKLNQDCYSLEFTSNEDVEDEVAIINSSSDKKRLNLLADGVLRKIAEHLENLNRIYNYRILEVHYEKVHCNDE